MDQDTAASFCNIRVSGVKGTDFENGSDVILFKDLSKVSAEGAIPITRNKNEPNPNSKPPNQEGIVKLSRNLEFWRRNRSTLGCRINNLESGEGAD